MRVRLAGVAVVAVLAAGCGGGGGSSSSDADTIVPADAVAFVTIATDASSPQVSSALEILRKFPIEPKAEQQLRASITQGGGNFKTITSSAGSEIDIAAILVNGKPHAVGLAKPSDEKAFDAQLDTAPSVHTTFKGWTLFADKQAALDAVTKRSGDSLADDPPYQAALKTLPGAGDAIARFYASSAGLQTALGAARSNLGPTASALGALPSAKWIAGALTSQDGAVKLEVHAKANTPALTHAGRSLADKIPAGSIVALAVQSSATRTIPSATADQLSALGQQLGVDLPGLISAINGPVIAYVRPGIPLPEVTLASQPAKPQAAATAVGGLLARFAQGAKTAKAVPTQVDGGTLNKLDLGPVSLYYGVNDGQLVVTDSANALAELKGSLGRLSADAVFKDAKSGAGMGDDNPSFLFVDIKDALPALSGFAQLANQSLPPAVENNLRPLKSLLSFGSTDGGVQSFVVYIKTS
jgi:hypothetical protein